jgi:hypothetical protein
MTRPPQVTVTIDRLVLRGFAVEQRDAIAAGLMSGLQRDLADPAIASRVGGSRSRAVVRTEPVVLPTYARPQQIGGAAAQRLARSLRL